MPMPRSRPWSASRSSWRSSLPAGPAALSVGGASCRGVPLVQVRRQLRGGSSVRRMRPAGERLLQGGPKFAGRILPVLSPVARARAPCVRAHVRIPGLVRPRALGSRQVPQALRTSQARPPPRTRPINADFASWETNSALIGRSLARRASSATSPAGRGAP